MIFITVQIRAAQQGGKNIKLNASSSSPGMGKQNQYSKHINEGICSAMCTVYNNNNYLYDSYDENNRQQSS
jgi:hypothetical protein